MPPTLRAAKTALARLGPGLIAGASDADPTSIATYAMAGATFGYSLLWVPLAALPLLAAVLFVCSKIGLVTGKGLIGVLRDQRRGNWVLIVVTALLISNTLTAGADFGAVAAGIGMMIPVPPSLLVLPLAALIVGAMALGTYRALGTISKILTLSLLAYVFASVPARPDWHAVLTNTFHPLAAPSRSYVQLAIAMFGTTLSPYVFVWQASEEVEDTLARPHPRRRRWKRPTLRDLHYTMWDIDVGQILYSVVTYFIILTTGATLFLAGKTHLATAVEAAQALAPLVGQRAKWLLGAGLIGSGMLSIEVILASSGFAMAEALGMPAGIGARPREAKAFFAVIAASATLGAALNFIGIGAMAALYWASVLNAFLTPPILLAIMSINRDRRLLGNRAGGRVASTLGWLAAAVMAVTAAGVVWSLL
ncbi:MAG: divalent metal cation transporter [Cyanobacteria bacterium REEB65]|nr:divalent metal cation transporter [Cyanobacteria bacterium REEB65]